MTQRNDFVPSIEMMARSMSMTMGVSYETVMLIMGRQLRYQHERMLAKREKQ